MLFQPIQRQLAGRLLESGGNLPPALRQFLENYSEQRNSVGVAGAIVVRIIFLCLLLFVNSIFSTLGGLLGVALFRKRLPQGPIDVPESTSRQRRTCRSVNMMLAGEILRYRLRFSIRDTERWRSTNFITRSVSAEGRSSSRATAVRAKRICTAPSWSRSGARARSPPRSSRPVVSERTSSSASCEASGSSAKRSPLPAPPPASPRHSGSTRCIASWTG